MKFISDVFFPSWPGKSVNPNFRQHQSYRNNDKFDSCLEIQSKTAARISISTLNPLKLLSNQIHIWCLSGRLILPKVGVDGFTRPQWESDVRYECHFKLVL